MLNKWRILYLEYNDKYSKCDRASIWQRKTLILYMKDECWNRWSCACTCTCITLLWMHIIVDRSNMASYWRRQHVIQAPARRSPEILAVLATLVLQLIRQRLDEARQVRQLQRSPQLVSAVSSRRIQVEAQRSRKQYRILVRLKYKAWKQLSSNRCLPWHCALTRKEHSRWSHKQRICTW